MRAPRTRVAACLAAAVVLASCGERDSGGATDPTSDPATDVPVTVVDGEVLLSCDGTAPGWPASAMVDGIEPPEPVAEIEAALSSAPIEPSLRREWKVLTAGDEELTLALGAWGEDGPARDATYMVLEPEGGSWRASNGGNCWQLAPVLPLDSSWAEVSADAVAPDATEVAVTVMERRCTGARDPLPHLDEPAFVVDDEAITVYWTSNPPDAAECPSNPSVPTTLTLPEPLGDRVLLDGSRWPAVPIG